MTKAPPPPPASPPLPPQQEKKSSPRATIPSSVALSLTAGVVAGAQRILLYGTGGIGKSTLAAYLPGALFLDLEDGTRALSVSRDAGTRDWMTLRGKLASIASAPPEGMATLVIDTATVAEELASEYVIEHRKTDKGQKVKSIEGFGWGKGYQYIYEEFNGLMADLDRIIATGIHVCMIAHVVSCSVPNPAGEDFIRWEPHLYAGDKKSRGSIRERVKQWADHVLFVGYDVYVQEGKGQGVGTRTIYTAEMPTHIAKSRTSQQALPFELQAPAAIWQALSILPTEPIS